MKIRVASYNIHKGVYRPLGQWRERVSIHAMREKLQQLNADLIFLQEVQGLHIGQAARHADWPTQPHYEYLAENTAFHVVYGQNRIHQHGDHGNVLLSRFPILEAENMDISDHGMEKRGLLHCTIDMDGAIAHCIVIHFGLFAGSRRRQNEMLINRINERVPEDAPLLIAGDFNDWTNRLNQQLYERIGVSEVFHNHQPAGFWRSLMPQFSTAPVNCGARPVRSFPSAMPLLQLDRIYQRGFAVHKAELLRGAPWRHLSDHCPLLTDLERMRT